LTDKVIHASKTIAGKMHLLKICGPLIRLCLFTFRPIASKQLNNLTTIDVLSWLGGAFITHSLGCKRLRVQFPVQARVFYVWLVFRCCCVFIFCPKAHYLSQKFCNSICNVYIFSIIVFLTYCKICDRL